MLTEATVLSKEFTELEPISHTGFVFLLAEAWVVYIFLNYSVVFESKVTK